MGCASTPGGGAAVPKKKILILGGTGFLGPRWWSWRRPRGHTLTLFNRGKTQPHLFPDVEKLHGDRDGDLKALEGRKWDAVIDTSGYVPRVVKASAELLAPNVGHYVFVSTISVYKDMSQSGIDESAPVATVEDEKTEDVSKHYGALKALSEKAAEAAMPGRATIVRPGLIVGPGDPTDRFTYWPVRVARGGEVLAPGDGAGSGAVHRREGPGRVHPRPGGAPGDGGTSTPPARCRRSPCAGCWRPASRPTAGNAHLHLGVRRVPRGEQKVRPWSDMPVWIPRSDKEAGGIGRVNTARALARGLTFRPLEDTARDTLAWFKTQPPERQEKLRAGLPAEREREVLAAWHQRAGDKPPAP